jgi:pimeloyl-ACP methyl ester carboxylesterase
MTRSYQSGFFPGFDGTKLYFSDEGEGTPLVLLDGLGCAGYIWGKLKPRFVKSSRVIHWNYRGHGHSMVPSDLSTMNLDALVQDLYELYEQRLLEKAFLVAHSMGVMVALEFYRKYPAKVMGMALMCGTYGNTLDNFMDGKIVPYLVKKIKNPLLSLSRHWIFQTGWKFALKPRRLTYHLTGIMVTNNYLMDANDFIVPFYSAMVNMKPEVFFALTYSLEHHSSHDVLSTVKVPTLIVAGQHDIFTPLAVSREMEALIPKADFLLLEKGRHTGPLEYAQLVNLRLEKFLQDHFK